MPKSGHFDPRTGSLLHQAHLPYGAAPERPGAVPVGWMDTGAADKIGRYRLFEDVQRFVTAMST